MNRITAGLVLGLVVCAFVPSFGCRAADAADKPTERASQVDNTLQGTWDITYTAVGTNTLPTPDNIALTFSAGMTNPANGDTVGTMTGKDNGAEIHNATWYITSPDPAINVFYIGGTSELSLVNISLTVTISDGIMTGTYSAFANGDSQGTVAGKKTGGGGGGGGKTPPPPKLPDVSGTWLFELTPVSFVTSNILTFGKADATGAGAVTDCTSGVEVYSYKVSSDDSITINTPGSSLLLIGTVGKDSMSGEYTASQGGGGNWNGVKVSAPKFLAVESLARTIGALYETKAVGLSDLGTFKLSATVPVPADVVAALNSKSNFSLAFGALNSNSTPIPFGSDYDPKSTTIELVTADALIKTYYELDWSKNTLKIKVASHYFHEFLPDPGQPYGVSPQAATYIEGSSESVSILNQSCVITLGTFQTTLTLGSVVGVTTADGTKTTKGITYVPSKVSIGTTIPKN